MRKTKVRKHQRRLRLGGKTIVKKHYRKLRKGPSINKPMSLDIRDLPLSYSDIEWMKINLSDKERILILNLALRDLDVLKQSNKRPLSRTGLITENFGDSSLIEEFEITGRHAIWGKKRTKQFYKWLSKNENKLDEIAHSLNYKRPGAKYYKIQEFYENGLSEYPDALFKKIMFLTYNKMFPYKKARSYTKDFEVFFENRFISVVDRKLQAAKMKQKAKMVDPYKSKKSKERYHGTVDPFHLYNIIRKMHSMNFFDYDLDLIKTNMLEMDDDELVQDMIKNTYGTSKSIQGEDILIGTDEDQADFLYMDKQASEMDADLDYQKHFEEQSIEEYLTYLEGEGLRNTVEYQDYRNKLLELYPIVKIAA